MPPLAWGGMTFLISFDDLAFAAVPSVILHLVWLLIDTCAAARYSVSKFNLDPVLLTYDAYVNAFVVVLDMSIGVLSAQGAVMKPRRHLKLLKCLILPRILGGVSLFLIFMYCVMCKFEDFFGWAFFNRVIRFSDSDGHVGGWGPVERKKWVVIVMELVMALRVFIILPGACFLVAILIPKDQQGRIATKGVGAALNFIGVAQDMIGELIAVLMSVVGQGTTDLAVPSDLFFGLQLVAAGQRQGALYFDGDQEGLPTTPNRSDDEEALHLKRGSIDMPKSAVRASSIRGVHKAPVPLQPLSNAHDQKVLREIAHYIPFAVGVYGLGMELFCESVYEHTSIPSVGKLCGTVRRAFSCCGAKPRPPSHGVLGDMCGRTNELSMRRALADAAEVTGTQTAELLWATWENRGAGTSPPLAVSLDFETRTVVVAVRGTMDVKDCVADVVATPVFFDPLRMAGPDDARQAPFDDNTGLFAHHTMVECAEDALSRLQAAGVLEDIFGPGGRACGWGLITVGHSLGAGVACLLALLLRGSGKAYASHARCVVFEPPGGLLSKRLSELAGQLDFVAAVCANDWISRLSVRTVQELRERILDNLATCRRSKWQLSMLMLARLAKLSRNVPILGCLFCCCCFGRPLSTLFECLGGGPLEIDCSSGESFRRMGFSTVRSSIKPGHEAAKESHSRHFNIQGRSLGSTNSRRSRGGSSPGGYESPGSPSGASSSGADLVALATRIGRQNTLNSKVGLFPELWPPSHVVYFRPRVLEWWLCKTYQRATDWTAEWIQPQDLHELIISPRSAELHFPNIIRDAYRCAAAGLGAISPVRQRGGGLCAASETSSSSADESGSGNSEDGME